MSTIQIVSGFSKTNRWLMYASAMLAPAQLLSGIDNNCPSNIGFLAYNLWTQVGWYRAIKAKRLHALSLCPIHFNILYYVTNMSGVTSGHIAIGAVLGVATVGLDTFQTVAAWKAYNEDLPAGIGVYQFFFFGWRTLTPNRRRFFCFWQVFDTILAVIFASAAFLLATKSPKIDPELKEYVTKWWIKPITITCGAAAVLIIAWPVILWTELIVTRNKLESATDWVAVGLFAAQVGAMLLPSAKQVLGCVRGRYGKRGRQNSDFSLSSDDVYPWI